MIKLITLFFLMGALTTFSIQCKKEDSNSVITGLNRSFKGNADSTVYASFYSSNIFALASANPTLNDSINYY